VLVGPGGELRKILDKQLESVGTVSWRPLRPAVAASDPAPDAPLRLGEGKELALRRLRGGSVVLSFWTSCSEPSIEQLRQLREALESEGEDRPYVLGIGDGEGPQQVAEVAKQEQLPFGSSRTRSGRSPAATASPPGRPRFRSVPREESWRPISGWSRG
jgi:AhpC/TSA family